VHVFDLHDYDGTTAFHRDFLEAADYLPLSPCSAAEVIVVP
jgi:hypothetical protein